MRACRWRLYRAGIAVLTVGLPDAGRRIQAVGCPPTMTACTIPRAGYAQVAALWCAAIRLARTPDDVPKETAVKAGEAFPTSQRFTVADRPVVPLGLTLDNCHLAVDARAAALDAA